MEYYFPTDNPTVAIRFVHKETRCPITELLACPTLSVSALKAMLEKKFSEEYSNMRIVDKYNFEGMKCLTAEDDDKCLSEVLPEGSTHYCYLEGPMTDTLDGLGQAVAISHESLKQDHRDLLTELSHQIRLLFEHTDDQNARMEKQFSELREHISVLEETLAEMQKTRQEQEKSKTAAICPLPCTEGGKTVTSRNRSASSNIANPKAKSSSPQTKKIKCSSSTQARWVKAPLTHELDDAADSVPLYYVVSEGDTASIELLVTRGSDVEEADTNGSVSRPCSLDALSLESVREKPEVCVKSRASAIRPQCPKSAPTGTLRNRAVSSNTAILKESSPHLKKNKRASSTQTRAVIPPFVDELDDEEDDSLNRHSDCAPIKAVFEAMRQGALTDDITSQIHNLKSGAASQITEADGAIDVGLACGSTPITMAVVTRRMDVLKELIARIPMSLTLTDVDGRSPLHMACFTGCVEATQLLIKAIATIRSTMRIVGLLVPRPPLFGTLFTLWCTSSNVITQDSLHCI